MRVVVGILLIQLLASCDRRKPLPKSHDAGPAVMVVDGRRNTTGAGSNGAHQPLDAESEPNDDVGHAQPLTPGHGISGQLVQAAGAAGKPGKPDSDYFTFVEPGVGGSDGGFNELRVTLLPTTVAVGGPAQSGALDVALEILDGDGARLAQIDDAPAGEPEIYPNLGAVPGHTYYLRVTTSAHTSKTAPAATQGGYTLTVERAPATEGAEQEPNDKIAQATALPGPDGHGYFGRRRDEDWLRIPTNGGSLLKLELGAVEGVGPKLRVESNGAVLARAETGRGGELRLRNVGLPPGVSEVQVLLSGDGRNPTTLWQLRFGVEAPLDGAEHEPNDSLAQANAIDDGVTVSGFLWPGDVDFYCTAKTAGGFVATLEGVDGVDLKLEAVSPAVNASGKVDVLARADAHKAGQGEELPATPRGTDGACYRITARAHDTAFDAPYRFTVKPAP